MTRALSSRSSKRKTVNSSQESIPAEYKQTSPTLLSQPTLQTKSKIRPTCGAAASKENVPPKSTPYTSLKSSQNSDKNNVLPLRKSIRHMNPSSNYQYEANKFTNERKVLYDKTNYSSSDKINDTSCSVLRARQDQGKTINQLNNSKPLSLVQTKNKIPVASNDCTNTNHVPVYKKIDCSQSSYISPNLFQSEKKEAIYEFEIDENEEPKQSKKRKKRVYSKKPKIGPKALTINNIKYGSTESLVSLPERPIGRKKEFNRNVKMKSCLSATNINDTQSSTCSVKSSMSHPPTLLYCQRETQWAKHDLSVLQETQSEHLQSPIPSVSTDLNNRSVNDNYTYNSLHSMDIVASNNLNPSSMHNVYLSPKLKLLKNDSNIDLNLDLQHPVYPNTDNDNILQNSSSRTGDISKISQDFLSSTPCKRVSLVVCSNSVFDDSYDFPQDLRPSTGFIKNSSGRSISKGSCFGFDEPEELEVPLLSPIKKDNDSNNKSKKPCVAQPITQPHKKEPSEKPTITEVIQMLKAAVPKTSKETREVDSDSPNHSPAVSNEEIQVNFRKPPRRSYERQRRVRYAEESEEESEPDVTKEECQEQETNLKNKPKEVNKCYRRGNSSRVVKSQKGAKGKQKIAKEEEEMERLAALINAQFQKIDKVDLVVE